MSRRATQTAGRTVATAMLGLLLAAAHSRAEAQSDGSRATPEQRRACRPDVYRLCAGEIPSVPRITACMRRNRASLSDACRAVFDQ